jgi:hypothetical protein
MASGHFQGFYMTAGLLVNAVYKSEKEEIRNCNKSLEYM